MANLIDMVAFLDGFFRVPLYPDEAGGVWRPSTRLVQRLGLALEPGPNLADWVRQEGLDALFMHRPWKLATDGLPPDVGIMAYHLPFDEHLTLGFNPRLAPSLGLDAPEVLGRKLGRALGMLGATDVQQFDDVWRQCEQVFGHVEEVLPGGSEEINRVAVMGAMTDALVREAAQRGAGVYITGQVRQPGLAAVRETGMGVIAIGHRRSELWGLRALAGVLRERWHGLEVAVSPET